MQGAISKRAYRFMKSPYRMEVMAAADRVGFCGSEDGGPFFRLYVKLNGDQIGAVSFQTYMCPWAMAVGSVLCELLERKALNEAEEITGMQLEQELEGVPRNRREVLALAEGALKAAIGNTNK